MAAQVKVGVEVTGGSSSYYKLPPGCTDLQDIIEYREMSFAQGNIFKAAYRMGIKPGVDELYDLDKIIWFAERRKAELKRKQTLTSCTILGDRDGDDVSPSAT